jgi:uncharacterized protein YbjT (DUF2867 family)
MRWTVLQPTMVYGPGSPSLRWLTRLTYGAPLLPVLVPARGTRFRPLWVGDLARGIATCLQRPETEGRTLQVAGPQVLTMGELVAALARARGVPHWQVGIPAHGARVAAGWVGRLAGLQPPGGMDRLGQDLPADPGPFVLATGVEPTGVQEGMRRCHEARKGRPFTL